ncbi:5-oxoprolinase subunit PxpA [Metabacillus fastidiosus]|uniref:LamB/YcsF family protein n=1 Tax=Metabacillus fastidiosus TaxID=1458 RepID=UPI002E21D82E|nr:LamB/YcsF family protein [Metabacillus fastidiosus]
MYEIDLNCDMGESFGSYTLGQDERIIRFITSANIACGFHAGDPAIMRKTVKLALEHDVNIGAHPGFQDLAGFGRRKMELTAKEVHDIVTYQIGALQAFTQAEGGQLNHVKPHGALYNMAAIDPSLAEAIAEAVYKINSELILYGLAGSELIRAGERVGIKTANEVFADRTYQYDGTLTSRNEKNALITNEDEAVSQVIQMIKLRKVRAVGGDEIPIEADTICIHGDGENASLFAEKINKKLLENNICIRATKRR